MSTEHELVDFALEELPGAELHRVLRELRERGPVQPALFLGIPSFVIVGHQALAEAFPDNHAFPGHRMYEASF